MSCTNLHMAASRTAEFRLSSATRSTQAAPGSVNTIFHSRSITKKTFLRDITLATLSSTSFCRA
jgi:hypothetical protein